MKLAVVCQLLSKFGMFTFVVLHAMGFSLKWWIKQKFWIFNEGTQWSGPTVDEIMVQR